MDASQNKLTILSYNFYCRPHFLFKDNQGVRAKLLAFKIKEYETTHKVHIDVVCLQEIFNNFLSDKVYKTINKEMAKIGFIYRSKRVSVTGSLLNGGSYILSRHIIVDKQTKSFSSSNSSIFNSMASKGISYAKIKYLNKDFHIISTHLDSFKAKYRKTQMIAMKKWLAKRKITDNIIIAGDYNIDFWSDEMDNVDEVFGDYSQPDLKFDAGTFNEFTMNADTNDFIKRRKNEESKKEKSFLDFFVFKSSCIKSADMTALELKHKQHANDILFSTEFMANIYTDKKTIDIEDMSDHYALLSNFYLQ